MNTNILIDDEEVLNKLKDTYLDEVLEDYIKEKNNKNFSDEKFFDAFRKLFEVLSYRSIILPIKVNFLDNRMATLFKKGRLPKDYNPLKDPKVTIGPMAIGVGPKGVNEIHARYALVFTSLEKLKKMKDIRFVTAYTLEELYDEYIKDNNDVDGIMINPLTDEFILSKPLCEFLLKGASDEDWEVIRNNAFKMMK